MTIIAVTEDTYNRHREKAKKYVPLGNKQPNPTRHPVPPIRETIRLENGQMYSIFNLEAAKKHPSWRYFYKPIGLSKEKPALKWAR